jgi:hypothetical protein
VVLVLNERVGLEHGVEPLTCIPCAIAKRRELPEVAGDLSLVPSSEDRLHVGEVPVERRTPDTGLCGDLRHRDRPQAVLGDQRRRGVERCVPHGLAVLLDRGVPKPRHYRRDR